MHNEPETVFMMPSNNWNTPADDLQPGDWEGHAFTEFPSMVPTRTFLPDHNISDIENEDLIEDLDDEREVGMPLDFSYNESLVESVIRKGLVWKSMILQIFPIPR